MSDYDTQHARHHGRPMDYTDTGSGRGLWIGLGLLVLVALLGLVLAGSGGGGEDATAPAVAEPDAIRPAGDAIAPAAEPGTAN